MSKRSMDAVDQAVAYFKQGYNCAQATAAVFAADVGLDAKTILRLMAGFGGGMGGMRETCGAVSAMVFAAGAIAGDHAPTDKHAKKALYAAVRQMVHAFAERHGSTCCGQLLRRAGYTPTADPSDRNEGYYAGRPCARFVASAAEIVAGTLRRRG